MVKTASQARLRASAASESSVAGCDSPGLGWRTRLGCLIVALLAGCGGGGGPAPVPPTAPAPVPPTAPAPVPPTAPTPVPVDPPARLAGAQCSGPGLSGWCVPVATATADLMPPPLPPDARPGGRQLHFVDAQRGVAVTPVGAVFVTEDGGKRWQRRATPLDVLGGDSIIGDRPADGRYRAWVGVGAAGPMLRTTDGGSSWRVAGRLPSLPADVLTHGADGQPASWTRHHWPVVRALGPDTLLALRSRHDCAACPGVLPHVLGPATELKAFVSVDGGAAWTAVGADPVPAGALPAGLITLDPALPAGVAYRGGRWGRGPLALMRWTGSGWQRVVPAEARGAPDFWIAWLDDAAAPEVLASWTIPGAPGTGSTRTVRRLRSTDGGQSWQESAATLPDALADLSEVRDAQWFAGGHGWLVQRSPMRDPTLVRYDLWGTRDGGLSWQWRSSPSASPGTGQTPSALITMPAALDHFSPYTILDADTVWQHDPNIPFSVGAARTNLISADGVFGYLQPQGTIVPPGVTAPASFAEHPYNAGFRNPGLRRVSDALLVEFGRDRGLPRWLVRGVDEFNNTGGYLQRPFAADSIGLQLEDDVAAFGLTFVDHRRGNWLRTDGATLSSNDGGASWQQRTGPSGTPLYRGLAGQLQYTADGTGWLSYVSHPSRWDGLFRSDDQGGSWQVVQLAAQAPGWMLNRQQGYRWQWAEDASARCPAANPGVALALTLHRTDDSGQTWAPLRCFAAGATVRFADVQRGVVADWTRGTMWVTADGGSQWTVATLDRAFLADRGVLTLDASGRGWLLPDDASGYAWRTEDFGRSWRSQGLPGTPIGLGDIAFADALHGWIVGRQGLVLATTDGGNTWLPQARVTSDDLNRVMALDAANVWISGGRGTPLITTATGGR